MYEIAFWVASLLVKWSHEGKNGVCGSLNLRVGICRCTSTPKSSIRLVQGSKKHCRFECACDPTCESMQSQCGHTQAGEQFSEHSCFLRNEAKVLGRLLEGFQQFLLLEIGFGKRNINVQGIKNISGWICGQAPRDLQKSRIYSSITIFSICKPLCVIGLLIFPHFLVNHELAQIFLLEHIILPQNPKSHKDRLQASRNANHLKWAQAYMIAFSFTLSSP